MSSIEIVNKLINKARLDLGNEFSFGRLSLLFCPLTVLLLMHLNKKMSGLSSNIYKYKDLRS